MMIKQSVKNEYGYKERWVLWCKVMLSWRNFKEEQSRELMYFDVKNGKLRNFFKPFI